MTDDRASRFTWQPDDIEPVVDTSAGVAETSPREQIRRAIGDAAHGMSDEDIDRIIAAAAAAAGPTA